MANTMLCKLMLIVLLNGVFCFGKEMDHGYLPICPGSEKSVVLTDSFLNKNIFFAVQIHIPSYYRKRYYFGNAIDGIGTDPHVDFKNRKTMVFLDGYLDSTNWPPARSAIGSYAAKGYNTITIDSQRLYSFIYPIASRTNRQVGNITATLLNGLLKYGLDPKDIELVGISMGAQTVSFVGKHFTRLSGKKVGRIISMDPSGPCFRNEDVNQRLSPNDADFVQVIHTGSEGFGMGTAVGHVDFYINGGEYQFFLLPYQPWCDEFCSHVLSFGFYYLALNSFPDQYVGVKCESVQQAREHKCYDNVPAVTNDLGPKADPNKPGIYYVPVSGEYPFYAPKDFIERRLNYALLYSDALDEQENLVIR